MATNFNPTELKYILECGVCLNRFDDPRVLPCLHSYCLECLKSHISSNKDNDGAFKCPQCRERCTLPEGEADNFPKNFFVNTMKDVIPASFLKEPNSEEDSSSAPVMCKHHSDDSQHGVPIVFCTQCDANFCEMCSKHHGMFDLMKNHTVSPVAGKDTKQGMKQSPNCELHPKLEINWYCRTCSLPACAECALQKHNGHATEKLSIIEAALKNDLLDVSKMAAERIKFLQKTLEDLASKRMKMEEELDQARKEISETADSICKLVRQHENTLQDKLKAARYTARKHFEQVIEEIETAKGNTSSLKSSADTLHQAFPERPLLTVLQAPIQKQQFLHQQEVPLSYVQWHLDRGAVDAGQLSSPSFMGNIDTEISTETSLQELQAENVILEIPINITKLEYKGDYGVCGIATIYKSNICVAHYAQQYIWVYGDGGTSLKQQIEIPDVEQISGMTAVDGSVGKLAIVNSKQCKIHFVTLSHDMEVLQHVIKELPFLPGGISMSCKREIVVSSMEEKSVTIFNPDGQVLSHTKLPVPHDKISSSSVEQTRSGLVVCDDTNKKIFFTDTDGIIIHTHTDCKSAWHAVNTSWGHVLVTDHLGDEVSVFSEGGHILGNIHTNSGSIKNPDFVHFDEAHRRLYIACGDFGGGEVRTYTFAPSELPPLPVTHAVTYMTVNVSLINV